MSNWKRFKIISAVSCKLFENAKNSQSKRGKIFLARIVNWLGNVYIEGFPVVIYELLDTQS
jgi:hypothetical protein